MSKTLDPMSVPPSWRVFLYDSVLLPFETGTSKTKAGKFDAKSIEANVGLPTVEEIENDLQQLQEVEGGNRNGGSQ